MVIYLSEHQVMSEGSKYVTKGHDEKESFDSGAVRDTQAGKSRYDLIPTFALKRVADLYARGAERYGDNNWQKGIPYSRCLSSLERHLHQWKQGQRDEDHLAAVVWNALAIMHYEETDRRELDDLFDYGEPQYVEDWETDPEYERGVELALERLGYNMTGMNKANTQLYLEGLDGGKCGPDGCDCA